MKRIALILLAVLGFAGLLVAAASGDDDRIDGDYLVRAYFDNAGFLVAGEEVRIAGARVGTIDEVDVSRVGEVVSESGEEIPGKAVAVLKIEDQGFQDFREDASCLIRPQSLLGEKFVECEPTEPRAPGSELPPALEQVPDGERGAGQLFLPLERNGKAVDLDLVNNITREPEADRLRLIINDLGAGFAARGEDLGEVIERANPALRETDRVLAILADQNEQLAQLARDSDTILTPLAREREALGGLIRNATTAGEAAAERREDIEAGLVEFPPALRELEATMVELQRFAAEAEPVATDLHTGASGLAGATEELGPFSRAGTTALTSLGDAADASIDDLIASQPVVRDLGKLGRVTAPGATALQRMLRSLRKVDGIDNLLKFVLYASNSFNGFDQLGHFLRANLLVTNCVEYVITPLSGCDTNWGVATTTGAPTRAEVEAEDAAVALDYLVGEG